jgi:hypothetical protein
MLTSSAMTKQINEGDSKLDTIPTGLAELMREWQSVAALKEWARDRDCSWWYGERASVSQLAGAAWKMGGWAMQEYAWTRGPEDSHARVDLSVEHKGAGLRFVAEAKQIYPSLTSRRTTVVAAIDKAFKQASAQLDEIPKDDWDRVALVFVSPYVDDVLDVEARIVEFISALHEIKDTSVWTFPSWARKNAIKSDVTDMFYPGAALLARHTAARRP